MLTAVAGGDLYVDKSFGKGGTGGTTSSSAASPFNANDATRSFNDAASPECTLEISLPALFLLAFPFPVECRPEAAETDVTDVAADIEAESREEVVGVLV